MITENDIIAVGKTGKTHGVRGEITISFDTEFDFDQCDYFVFEMDAIFVPFFIESSRRKNETTMLVKIDGIDDEPAARELCGKTVFVKKELITEADELALDYFIGFEIVDERLGKIGTIDDIDDSTANTLFAVGEQLIPVSEDFIVEIDHDRKILTMNLPDGLLQL